MTQAERFLQLAQEHFERSVAEAKVTLRIEDGELVVTRHWQAATQEYVNEKGEAKDYAKS
jgi:hypothetical protein